VTEKSEFQAMYRNARLYDDVLPQHLFNGVEDVELVARLMRDHFGRPASSRALSVVEFGCGSGRVTASLAPYASKLVAVDKSPSMVATAAARYPSANVRCLDMQQAVAQMVDDEGLVGTFDVVGAFWSLSYPLGECFEELTVDGIQPAHDQTRARQRAGRLVRDLIRLVAPDGHLLVLFFDSETREQRLVTRLWERIAPFPEGGRDYTRKILVEELRAAEDRGDGWLTHTRHGGVAVLPTKQAALAWFRHAHLKDLPMLVNDPVVQDEICRFIDACTVPSGTVVIPSGAHVLDFRARSPFSEW